MKEKKLSYEELKNQYDTLVKENKKLKKQVVLIAQEENISKKENISISFEGEILKNITEGINLVRACDGIIVFTNDRFNQMFNYDSGELIGKHISIVNAPIDKSPEEVASEIINHLSQEGFWKGEVKNIRKDGSTFWCQANITAFKHTQFGEVWLSVHEDITEHKQAEEALKKREELLRTVLSNAPITMFATDSNGIFTLSEGKKLELVNLKPGENVGLSAIDLYDSFPFVERNGKVTTGRNVIRRVLEGETVNAYSELRGITFDNHLVPILTSDGKVDGLLGIAIDITERKQVEDALRESENKFKSIIQSQAEGIGFVDQNEIFEFVNHAAEKIFETVKDGLIGVSLLDFLNPGEKEKIIQQTHNRKKGINGEYELQIVTKKGNAKYIHVSVTPKFDKNGNYLGAYGVFSDITERKHSENKLKESEEKYRNLIEFLPTIIYETDLSGNYTYVNKSGYAITGYSEKDIEKGLNINELIIPEQRELAFETMKQILNGKDLGLNEYILRKKNGELFPVYIKTMVTYFNDKPNGFRGIVLDISEQKEILSRLKESEEKFSKAFMISPYAISITEAKTGKFVEVNEYFSTMSGFIRDEILSASSVDLNMWNDVKDRNQVLDDVLKGRKVTGKEFKFRNKKGEILVGLFSAEIIILNKQTYILSSIDDITDSVKAKEAMLESEKKYRLLADNSADVIFIFDMDMNFTYVSPSVKRLRGYDPEEIIGQPVSNSLTTEGLITAQRVMKEELERDKKGNADPNRSRVLELEMRCKDGSTIWTEVKTSVLKDEKNNNIGIIGATRNISERKKAENALLESQKIIEEIINTIPVRVFWKDRNLVFLGCNTAFAHDAGFSDPKDIIGKDDYQMVWRDQAELYRYDDLHVIENGYSKLHIEEPQTTPEGNIITLLTSKIPLRNSKGEISGILGTYMDITELKQAEAELIKAKEKAEESDRLKSAFLANMSHEIRTPMNGILGFAELLTEPNLTGEKQREYISIIENSGKRMLNIINDIVDISKIESGQMAVFISETNINEQIQYLYDFFKTEGEQKGIQILFKNLLPAKESIIKTDKQKVYAILTNLIKNAIKFTNKGSIEFGYEKKGEYLEFFVKDTGTGICQEQREIIFERFRQGSESFTRNYEGAGLGLSISKAYVEILGGKIWVESEKENLPADKAGGSTFYFTIPYLYEPEEKTMTDKDVPIKEDVKGKEMHVRNNLKILIAEDDEASERLIKIIINKFSKEVLIVRTGVEAVNTSRNNPDIDLILMDVYMSEINGYEATMQIRQFNKEVIIIAQTAYALSGEKEKALEAGCNDYISKPINQNILKELINKHFVKVND